MRRNFTCGVASVCGLGPVLVLACACSRSSPVTPTATAAIAPGPATYETIRVTSGVGNRAPVTGARVTIGGRIYTTDSNGEVYAEAGSGFQAGSAVDVEAPGFLLRQTLFRVNTSITLWPVANAAEADALHEMLYQTSGPVAGTVNDPGRGPFSLTMADPTPDQRSAWMAEGAVFGAQFNVSYYYSNSFQYEPGEVDVAFEGRKGSSRCTPSQVLGFCRTDSSYYADFAVDSRHALDRTTIDRVLASAFFAKPNPLRGFLSATAPANELSDLERNAIEMLLLRTSALLPNRALRWPDNDR